MEKLKTEMISPSMQQKLIKFGLAGAGLGLVLASAAVWSIEEPRLEWGNYWMIRPMLVLPVIMAIGFFFTRLLWFFSSEKTVILKTTLRTAAIVGALVSMWMGFILGFVGTIWN